jgi:phosphoribosyl-ATP pyrophosphohydrolase
MTTHRLEVLAALAAEISKRKTASPDQSYTAKLLVQGVEKCAKKLGEEAVETAIAAVLRDKSHVTSEAADLLYHLLVLLEAAGVRLIDVMSELERRQGTSGIAEKAARPKD